MSPKILSIGAVVLGIAFVLLAILYWLTPANALPSFIPGYDPALSIIHFKHGLASLLLGLVLFAFAWFKSAKRSASQ